MYTTHLWNKRNIYGRKIGLTLFFCILFLDGFSQKQWSIFNQSGGDNKTFSYGFFLAAHTSSLRLKYSAAFLDPDATAIADVHSIMPTFSPGFDLGFLLTTRLHDQFNVLITPKVGFYEYRTEVQFYSGGTNQDPTQAELGHSGFLTEETLVEFPLLLKYKSQRFNNTRMFFVAGINPRIRTKNQDEADEDDIVLTGKDLALEMGMGFDLYFKYFKFSPEIRFSHGLKNLYRKDNTDPRIAGAISEIRKKSITLYLNFQ